jgi:perosamine synthetase
MSGHAIPNYIPRLIGREAEYLKECVDTGWVSSVGPFVDRFEDGFAKYHGVEQAAAVSSGTAAIHLGLVGVGVEPGDLVICPTVTFIGTINPIRYCGADPILVDVEPQTLNMDLDLLDERLAQETDRTDRGLMHRPTGRRIGALLVVHLYGNPMDMDRTLAIAQKYGVPVVEDAAESLGARWRGRLVGTFGDAGCFSFNGNKVITTGGGGMLISVTPGFTKRIKHLATQARTDPFEFTHDAIGFNYRLSNLCAAVGVAQMEHLDSFIAAKRAHGASYAKAFGRDSGWAIVEPPAGASGTYWMVLARRSTRDVPLIPVLRDLAKRGIGVRPIWLPIHRIPLYATAPAWTTGVAEAAYDTVCCLPSSVGLTSDEISRVAEAVRAVAAHP